jgi:hypothetical protein
MKEHAHYTVTMARVYAEQGYWEKAVEIYGYLLAEDPARRDLADALADAKKNLEESAAGLESERLVPLFSRWLDVMSQYDRLRKLKRISNAGRD